MKIGVTYNIFNGEELLEGSIKSIRDSVDFIGVVYQTISNHGEEAPERLYLTIKRLVNDGLIDVVIKYNPLPINAKANELDKRNLGLELSKSNGCDYHMSMDSDEFYKKDEFNYMVKTIIDGDYDMGVCQMCSYYKSPEYQLSPKEDYFVSVLHKITEQTKFVMNQPCSVVVDPTRKINFNKLKIFARNEIEMHHMTYVRDDIFSKLNNAGAKPIYQNNIKKIGDYFNNWEYPMKAMLAGPQLRYFDVVKIDNYFYE